MENESPIIYGLEFQARALCPQQIPAESDTVGFYIGTQSLRSDNQVHLLELDEENNQLIKHAYLHRGGEIWAIAASPNTHNLISTCYNSVCDMSVECHAAVWRVPDKYDLSPQEGDTATIPPLELQCRLEEENQGGTIAGVLWQPTEASKVICMTNTVARLLDINTGSQEAKEIGRLTLEGKGQAEFQCGRWSPHKSGMLLSMGNGTFIRGWDLRTMKSTFVIEGAHEQLVRDMDCNPNQQYQIVSCGDDCRTRFWDVRNPTKPLMSRSDHSHWVWSVRYNPHHDALVLTASSDSRVVLASVASISSEPYGHLLDDEATEGERSAPLEDGVLAIYEEHEDSVYAAEWSVADPWTLASLSYDGRLVVNKVPTATQYKILL